MPTHACTSNAITIAKQIDYLGGAPTVTAKPVKTSDKATDLLRFDLENENVVESSDTTAGEAPWCVA